MRSRDDTAQATAYKLEREQFLKRFGANLRRLRTASAGGSRERGISQEELAFLTQLHRTEIGSLEQGRVEPRLTTLLILARGLNVTLDQLVAGLETPTERRPGPRSRRLR